MLIVPFSCGLPIFVEYSNGKRAEHSAPLPLEILSPPIQIAFSGELANTAVR